MIHRYATNEDNEERATRSLCIRILLFLVPSKLLSRRVGRLAQGRNCARKVAPAGISERVSCMNLVNLDFPPSQQNTHQQMYEGILPPRPDRQAPITSLRIFVNPLPQHSIKSLPFLHVANRYLCRQILRSLLGNDQRRLGENLLMILLGLEA